MPNEEKTPTQKEIEMQAIEEIGKQITDYFLYVVKHMKFDENGNPIATPELKEYMENERKKFKERSKVFSNKAFSEYLQQHISKSLSESEEWAAACARVKDFRKTEKTPNELMLTAEQWYTTCMPDFSNSIAGFKKEKASINQFEDFAEVVTKHGTLKIIDYSKLKSKKLNLLSNKVLDICILKISQTLVHGATNPNNRYISFTVEELAELTNQSLETPKQREKFIERIYESTKQLSSVHWIQSNENKTRKIKNLKYDEIALYEYTGKEKNVFKFMFTQTAAYLIANSPQCESFPTNLFKLDNRYGGNAYEIARKMIRHTDNYSNRKKGTNCTLSVTKLIENSAIPSFEELENQNRRDWKEKIKKPFEKALNDLLNVNVLSRWEYRTPTGKRYTTKQADKLNSLEYQNLVVDFSMFYSDEEYNKRLTTENHKLTDKKCTETKGEI